MFESYDRSTTGGLGELFQVKGLSQASDPCTYNPIEAMANAGQSTPAGQDYVS
jgi:hypothetical protein